MEKSEGQTKLPLGTAMINVAGSALILTSVIIMFVTDPKAASPTRSLFEFLMLAGVFCYLVFGFRYWQWIKRRRLQSRMDT